MTHLAIKKGMLEELRKCVARRQWIPHKLNHWINECLRWMELRHSTPYHIEPGDWFYGLVEPDWELLESLYEPEEREEDIYL